MLDTFMFDLPSSARDLGRLHPEFNSQQKNGEVGLAGFDREKRAQGIADIGLQ